MSRIAFLTGKRGGYEALLPVLYQIHDSKKHELRIIATDQHFSKSFGYTIDLLYDNHEREQIIECPTNWTDSSTTPLGYICKAGDMLESIGRALFDHQIDYLILYGDRVETLCAAIAARTLQIPIVHIQGGDATGSLDDYWRHAVSHMSTLHLCSTDLARSRLIGMQVPGKIIQVGEIKMDRIFEGKYEKLPEPSSKKLICIYHPDSESPKTAREEATTLKRIFERMARQGWEIIISGPCSDPGNREVKVSLFSTQYKCEAHIPVNRFLGELATATLFIGNSSTAVMEAPALGIPSIVLGNRQEGRPLDVLCVPCPVITEDRVKSAIQEGLKKTGMTPSYRYGRGGVGNRIASNILRLATEGQKDD